MFRHRFRLRAKIAKFSNLNYFSKVIVAQEDRLDIWTINLNSISLGIPIASLTSNLSPMKMKNAKNVLIVDDDDDIRLILSIILKDEGYNTLELTCGKHVIETVDTFHPDIVLLDVMLGDSDGRDICNELKNQSSTCDIPILIVSASHGRKDLSGKYCKANSFINKPFDIQEVIEEVKRYVA